MSLNPLGTSSTAVRTVSPSQTSNRPRTIMPFLIRTWPLFVGLVAALLFLPGCNQQNKITVSGSVLRNGQSISVSPTGYVQVTLMPDVGADEQYTTRQARCEKDG